MQDIQAVRKLLSKTTEDHPDYEPLMERLRELTLQEQKKQEYREKPTKLVLELAQCYRRLSRSKLCYYNNGQLVEIGKLLAQLEKLLVDYNRSLSTKPNDHY